MTIALVAVSVVALAVLALQARAGARTRARAASLGRRVEAAEGARDRAIADLDAALQARTDAERSAREAAERLVEVAPGEATPPEKPAGGAGTPVDDPAQTDELPRAAGGQGGGGLVIRAAQAGEPGAATAPTPPPAPEAAATPTTSAVGTAALDALWHLDVADRARAARREATTSTAAAQVDPGLQAALAAEVGRLREETGTPGTLRVDLPGEPAAGDAVVLVRAVQSLLGVLGRHAQGYDLYLHSFADRAIVVLVCDDFDGPDSVADEVAELGAALARIDGRIDLDRDDAGRLRARCSLPTTLGS